MTGINRLNIFVNFSDRILPHVPTWRRNWSWFRCEPALFCFCSRSPGGFLGRKSTVSRVSFARAWRAGFFGAKVLLWADGKKRLRLMSLWCQRQLSAKFLRFLRKKGVCRTECKILTFRSHSPQKSAEKKEHCRSFAVFGCGKAEKNVAAARARRLWGAAGFGISLTLRPFSCLLAHRVQ